MKGPILVFTESTVNQGGGVYPKCIWYIMIYLYLNFGYIWYKWWGKLHVYTHLYPTTLHRGIQHLFALLNQGQQKMTQIVVVWSQNWWDISCCGVRLFCVGNHGGKFIEDGSWHVFFGDRYHHHHHHHHRHHHHHHHHRVWPPLPVTVTFFHRASQHIYLEGEHPNNRHSLLGDLIQNNHLPIKTSWCHSGCFQK